MIHKPLWMEQAACRGQTKTMALPDLHRDDGRRGGTSYTVYQLAQIARARCICAHCPVLDDCRAWVLSGDDDPAVGMVAAGMVPRQRDDIRKARRRGVA